MQKKTFAFLEACDVKENSVIIPENYLDYLF